MHGWSNSRGDSKDGYASIGGGPRKLPRSDRHMHVFGIDEEGALVGVALGGTIAE